MRDTIERSLAIADELGRMADARIKELEAANSDLSEQLVQLNGERDRWEVRAKQMGRDIESLQSQLAQLLQSQESTLDHNRSLIAELAQAEQERDNLRQQLSGEQAFDLIAPRTLKKEVRDVIEELK